MTNDTSTPKSASAAGGPAGGGKRRRVCDHAVDVLRETGNPAVMVGDTSLLHQIAARAGIPADTRTERRVLGALNRTPGVLVKGFTRTDVFAGFCGRRSQRVRVYRLPPEPDTRTDAPSSARPRGALTQD